MKLYKRVLRTDLVRRTLCRTAAAYIRLVHMTTRWTYVRPAPARQLWKEGKPFIAAFWHGRMLPMPCFWESDMTVYMLISQHPDGQLIARTIKHLGFDSIAGSSTHGGSGALRALIKAIADGACIGITPDGPHGPRMRVGDGVIALARLSGVPILPATYATNSQRILGTWDRFALAWPFGRGVLVWGDAVEVPRDAHADALEGARRRLEDTLNAITAEADALCGQPAVEPAPVPAAAPS